MEQAPKKPGPERVILTRLFAAQRRLRFVRGHRAALRWFAGGAALSTVALLVLWNWNLLPGPWQWLAAAGRPRELLWLPLLTALGGFATCWFVLPNPRKAAYRLDQLMDSQERVLTSVDWILSEKPRTVSSERLLDQSAALLEDEQEFHRHLKGMERIPPKMHAMLLSLALPLLLLFLLPPHTGLDPSAAVWMGESQVDQLTEDLLKELQETGLEDPEEQLEKLLKELENQNPGDPESAETRKELQRTVDQVMQQAEAQQKARELLETLAQRARQSQEMSDKDRQALKTLREAMKEGDQQERLDQASQSWEEGDFENAAETLESLQQEAGQSAESQSQAAGEAASEGGLEPDGGQEFNEGQGDQFKEGFANGEGPGEGHQGQGQATGQDSGDGEGGGEGTPGSGVGKGTTLEDQGDSPGAQGRQSLRRGDEESEWVEEYEHLHAPERTEYEKGQTRVKGQVGEDGPRYRTEKEGRGAVTEPSNRQGSGGLLEYREAAENAILREEVPADYRDNVRVYFESLDNGR
jgi:hypothetical protein